MVVVAVRVLLYLIVPFMVLLPIYTYRMAVSHHQEKPFPHATITMTACHYPQDVPFRFCMMLITAGIGLLFWSLNLALQRIATKYKYPHALSGIYVKTGMLMTFSYALTIGTIDEGRTSNIHDINAVIFFVLLFVTMIDVTCIAYRLRQWDIRAISDCSWNLKLLMTNLVATTWLLQLILILTGIGKSSDHIVIVEYMSNYTAAGWLLSFYFEFKDIYFELS